MAEKRILDDATKKLLEGLTSFNVSAHIWYTAGIHSSLPEDIKPSFKLRSFRKNEMDAVKKLLSKIDSVKEDELKEYVRYCILDWKNWYDAGTGELIDFKISPDGNMDKDLFNTIPTQVVTDLLLYIIKISGLMNIEKSSL